MGTRDEALAHQMWGWTRESTGPPAFQVGQRVVVVSDAGTRFTDTDGCFGHVVSTYGGRGNNPGMSKVRIEGRVGKPLNRMWPRDDGGPDEFSNNEIEAAD